MTQHTGSSEWIDAYLEWTETDFGTDEQPFAYWGVDTGFDASANLAAPEPLREAVLLMALRTESECMHILRQALDEGIPTTRTLRLAVEAIECAKSLLDNERRAWRALEALHPEDARGARIDWSGASQLDWPCALENVEADLRALSGRILELRPH